MIKSVTKYFSNFLKSTTGNVAVTFAVLAVPLFGAAGVAVDYTRTMALKTDIQSSVDAALLAGANEARKNIAEGKSITAAIEIGKEMALLYHKTNHLDQSNAPVADFDPIFNVTNSEVTASATVSGSLPTSLSAVLGITEASYVVNSTVGLSAPSFVEVYFVIDNSNSMGIGATVADMETMQNSSMSCAFACHVPATSTNWTSTLSDARSLGVTLRLDVVKDAIRQMLTNIENQGLGVQVKSAVYSLSNTITQEQSVTEIHSNSIASLDGIDLAGDWGSGGTSFDHALDELEDMIGVSGSGASQATAKKIVVLVTDGVATNVIYQQGGVNDVAPDSNFRNYGTVVNGSPGDAWSIQGFNPKACEDLKIMNNVNLYTVNVEYLTPPTVKSGDTRFDDINNRLQTSIESNLEECSSNGDQFFTANTPAQIYDTFDTLLNELLLDDLTLTQ